ncbi:MAG TPA: hypothetical protein VFJ07_14825 [Streptosporangiaceae bacterium]|nr:hypothetical protein [Streptosporangiaceae bacterium]
MTQPARETCPVDLHYPEPEAADLDLPAIVGRGRRIRRGQRLGKAAAAIVTCVALASIAVGLRGTTFTWFPGRSQAPAGRAVTPIDSIIAIHPPVGGKLTLLSNRPTGWSTVAWATRDGQVCWLTYHTVAGGGEQDECWARTDIPGRGSSDFGPLMPTTELYPVRRVAEFGLVTPRAARVTVTFFGRRFSAGVVPVPMGGGKTAGVYMIWLAVPASASGSGGSDVGGAVAYDHAGHVVARHGPGL